MLIVVVEAFFISFAFLTYPSKKNVTSVESIHSHKSYATICRLNFIFIATFISSSHMLSRAVKSHHFISFTPYLTDSL